MTTKAKTKQPVSLLQDPRFIAGELTNKDIREIVADDETKRYHMQVIKGAPVTQITMCGLTIDFRTRPVDPVTQEREIHNGVIIDLSPRLVEVMEHKLKHQVATVQFARNPKTRTVDKTKRNYHGTEYFEGRESALGRIMARPDIHTPGYDEPTGTRELMSNWVTIKETDALSTDNAMILKLENEKQRAELRELRAKLAQKETV